MGKAILEVIECIVILPLLMVGGILLIITQILAVAYFIMEAATLYAYKAVHNRRRDHKAG